MSAYGLNKVVRKDSISGVLGVSIGNVYSGSTGKLLKHKTVRAYFRNKSKKFSTKKYGRTLAFKMGELWREKKIIDEKMKAIEIVVDIR